MKKGLSLMMVGAGLGIGSLITYQQYRNGNMQKHITIWKQNPKSQGNMM